jgi:hypothetical protein
MSRGVPYEILDAGCISFASDYPHGDGAWLESPSGGGRPFVPLTASTLVRDVWPETIDTVRRGTPSQPATASMVALLAAPSTGGCWIHSSRRMPSQTCRGRDARG